MTKDPVCGMQIDEKQAKAKTEHKGRDYYFCSEHCKERFDKNPEQYAKKTA